MALRETAAMVATARWCLSAARARTETRGIHVRADFPAERQQGPFKAGARLLVGGLDAVWTRSEKLALEAAA